MDLALKKVVPVIASSAILILFLQFDMLTARANGAYIRLLGIGPETIALGKGYCSYGGESFDRLAAGNTWETKSGYIRGFVVDESGACKVPDGTFRPVGFHTPAGTAINPKDNVVRVPDWLKNRMAETAWSPAQNLLSKHPLLSELTTIIISLGVGIVFLFSAGHLGLLCGIIILLLHKRGWLQLAADNVVSLLRRPRGVQRVNLGIIMGCLLLLGGACCIMVSIHTAAGNIDPVRFAIYDNLYGRIAATAANFWPVLFASGLLPALLPLFQVMLEAVNNREPATWDGEGTLDLNCRSEVQ